MGSVSVGLNVITICISIVLIYIISRLYKSSVEQGVTVAEVMRRLEKTPSSISHAYFYDQYDPDSAAGGIEWSDDIHSGVAREATAMSALE